MLFQIYSTNRSFNSSSATESVQADSRCSKLAESSGKAEDDNTGPNARQFLELLESLDIPILTVSEYDARYEPSLGEGGFGEVRFTQVQPMFSTESSGAIVKELKASTVANMREDEQFKATWTGALKEAYTEICIMRHPNLVEHPHILQLIGTTTWSTWIQSANWGEICLVTEHADLGSLDAYLKRYPSRSWSLKQKLIGDIVLGLKALHSYDIVHNDLKSANILLFSQYHGNNGRITAKIADFGCAVPLATTEKIFRGPGTLIYSAPETYVKACRVHPSRDFYALGLLLVHIISHRDPFDGLSDDRVMRLKEREGAVWNHVSPLLDYSDTFRELKQSYVTYHLSDQFGTVVQQLLRLKVEERPSDLGAIMKLCE